MMIQMEIEAMMFLSAFNLALLFITIFLILAMFILLKNDAENLLERIEKDKKEFEHDRK